jgi:Protein of unknown function (DUF4058)
MPVHDWTRVDAGVFHDFHNVWIALLRMAFNSGLLPEGFYAMSEQHAGKYIADVLTLQRPAEPAAPRVISGGLALAEAPPKVRHHRSLSPTARNLRKTLTIRHVSEQRIIALVEIVSGANKDRRDHVDALLNKMEEAVSHGVHLLVVDLFPPGKHDPAGLHSALLERLGDEVEGPPPGKPVTLASYVADARIKTYWEYLAFGSALPDMPLFLDPEIYVKTPLETTYQTAWQSTPELYREILEKPHGPPRRKRGR